MSVFRHPDRHHVAVLVRPGLLVMELGLVHRLFGQARSAEGEPLYEVVTCTPEPGELHSDADVRIPVETGPEAVAEADTVIVPASSMEYEPDASRITPPVRGAMEQIRPGTRIASICTGAFVLAAMGLLDGRRATTHWRSADEFRQQYPRVRLDPDVLYTEDGDVFTSAGVASGIDLCLHLIRRDFGAAVANEVARGTVCRRTGTVGVSPHREGGQAQFIRRPVAAPRPSSTGAARAWALEHLHRPLTLRELAARESMSTRTFTRRFRDEVGVSALQWLTQQRVSRAQQLLEETDRPIDRIAAECGFGTAASLRQHLQSAIGVSPSAYRSTFRRTA
ncbi:helix-turn-helix domain-containing protein [Amycolatopsis sp. PS_44_ISF1]|uniref:GlxA family transcriptional regulator n=1 Tax=Amycolatopsis sp. PS_44_ISF1 TaxID=2974917 RepID=UPI0028E0187B|nr:helix-turn-helix domain-containing protein [Amycolatopsis sp. PS_44_ISF1]MDT8909505.1 helix-turn-helix domain-containing protein [Amycolatopsis sp. PS_44_ISF1]